MLGACELAQGTNSHVIATPLRTVCGADGSMSGVSQWTRLTPNWEVGNVKHTKSKLTLI